MVPTRHLKPAAVALLALLLGSSGAFAQGVPPIKIGFIFSFSGDTSAVARLTDAAVNTFIREHGDTVAGRKIELIRRDDTGPNPEVARRLAQELVVQDHVDMLIGSAFTPNAIAIASVSTAAKKPYLIVNAATSGIMAKAPYTARFGFTTAQITTPFARWAVVNGYKTAFAVFQNYGPGIDAGASFEKTFTQYGGQMLGEVRMPVNNPDFTAYIQRVKDAKPDVVFVFINASGGGAVFLKACKTAGLEQAGIHVIATGDVVDEPLLPIEGDVALGLVTTFDYSSTHDSNLNRRFIRDFQATLGTKEYPDFGAVQAYDVMQAVYKIIAAQNGHIDPDRTMELVKGMKFESPRGPIMIDPVTRDIVQNVYFRRTEKRDGRYQNVEFTSIPMVRDPNEGG